MKQAGFVFLMLMAIGTQAQFQKGTRIVGATIGTGFFNSGKSDITYPTNSALNYTSSTTTFNLAASPNYGWFLNDKTAVGVSLIVNVNNSYVADKTTSVRFRETNSSGFNVGVGGFVRNYFNTSSRFMPYGQASINLGVATSRSDGFYFDDTVQVDFDEKSTGGFFTNAGLSFGATKMIGKSIGLDVFIGYNLSLTRGKFNRTTELDGGDLGFSRTETESRFTGHGVVFGLGFQLFLDPKKK